MCLWTFLDLLGLISSWWLTPDAEMDAAEIGWCIDALKFRNDEGQNVRRHG